MDRSKSFFSSLSKTDSHFWTGSKRGEGRGGEGLSRIFVCNADIVFNNCSCLISKTWEKIPVCAFYFESNLNNTIQDTSHHYYILTFFPSRFILLYFIVYFLLNFTPFGVQQVIIVYFNVQRHIERSKLKKKCFNKISMIHF